MYWYIWNETCDNGLTWQQNTATVLFGVLLARDNPVSPQWSFAKTTCSWKLHNTLLTITHIQWSIAQPTDVCTIYLDGKLLDSSPNCSRSNTWTIWQLFWHSVHVHMIWSFPWDLLLKNVQTYKILLKIYIFDTVISDLYWFRKNSCAVYINEENAYINVYAYI